ncbi:MAG: hypothetical protein AAFN10_03070, partial [Bacteroidota bacterium]
MKKFRITEELSREAFHLAINKTIQAIEFGQFQGFIKCRRCLFFGDTASLNRTDDILIRQSFCLSIV